LWPVISTERSLWRMDANVLWLESSWRLFPRWLKLLTLVVGLPAWLGFAALIVTGSIFEHQSATLTLFAALLVVALCQTFFITRAARRDAP
jgi:hypothetical protein